MTKKLNFLSTLALLQNALQMSQQLQYFTQYKVKLQDIVGRIRAANQIKEAVFYINAGSADLILHHFPNAFYDFREPNNLQTLPPSPYEDSLLERTEQFIQGLWVQGARKFAVQGLPPMGCIPIVINRLPLDPDNHEVQNSKRKCLEYVNNISRAFNSLLQDKLQDLESKLSDTKFAYIDFEESLLDAIEHPRDNGFDEVNKGCCPRIRCSAMTPICADASKYVFWDAGHPTEKTNDIIFMSNLPAIEDLFGN